MPGRDYHDEIWATVPPDAVPKQFERRRAFLLAHVQAGQRVLDVGCGDGSFLVELAGAGVQTVGIDVSGEALVRARARLGMTDADLRLVDADAPWPLPDGEYDAVWAGEVIEHVADTALWLSEVRRVLAPGGLLLTTTPDHGPLAFARMTFSRGARTAAFDPLSDHLRFYNRETLATLLSEFGFDDIKVQGVGGIPGARRTLLARARRAGFTMARPG